MRVRPGPGAARHSSHAAARLGPVPAASGLARPWQGVLASMRALKAAWPSRDGWVAAAAMLAVLLVWADWVAGI